MKVILSIAFVALSVYTSIADKSPNPAVVSYSGCGLKNGVPKCCTNKKTDVDIQMGEAWSNLRVMNQHFAVFVPYKPGTKSYDSEGGPYGDVTACNCYPTESEMVKVDNLANWCFFWDGKDHTGSGSGSSSGSSSGWVIPHAPGEKATPMPIVCPSNLPNCYSANYYEPGGKLAAYANVKPTYRGIWFPLQDKSSRKPLFCNGLNLGCPTPTMRMLQLQHLAKANCDPSRCQKHPSAG